MSSILHLGRWILILAIIIAGFATGTKAYAKVVSQIDYHDRTAKQSLAQWVRLSAQGAITPAAAATIVHEVYKQATAQKVDPLLILSIMRHESGFRANASSSHGARCLMQVIPYWHRDKIRKRNIFDPGVCVEVGTRVLADCLTKGKDNTSKALSCYSGGANVAYRERIKKTHNQARQVLIAHSFHNNLALTALPQFDRPRWQPLAPAIQMAAVENRS